VSNFGGRIEFFCCRIDISCDRLLVHSRTVSVTNQLYLRNYVGNKFALVFWNDDQQFSVGKEEDITVEAKLGEIRPVAWRVKKKKKGEVITSWYEAKILQFSGKLIFYSCVLSIDVIINISLIPFVICLAVGCCRCILWCVFMCKPYNELLHLHL
jgi:hypothetical protein